MIKRNNLSKIGKKGSKGKTTRYALFLMGAILAVSSVLMTVETATSSTEVSKLREAETILINEKRSLENTLAQSLSMSDLRQRGNEMGYVEPSNLVYVSGSHETMARLP